MRYGVSMEIILKMSDVISENNWYYAWKYKNIHIVTKG